MDKKRVGIITTSNAVNYGAVLQTYALMTAFNNSTECETYVVDYAADPHIMGHCTFRKITSLRNMLINIYIFFNFKYRYSRKKIIKYFDDFRKNHLKLTDEQYSDINELKSKLNTNEYYAFIAGSDQIWNLNLMKDESYFLSFCAGSDVLKYSYAASITEDFDAQKEEYIKSHIKNFNGISVREKKSAQDLENIINRKVLNNIDPVFLLKKQEWLSMIKETEKSIEGDYILVFRISRSNYDQIYVDKIKKKYKCKTVYINLLSINNLKSDITLDHVTVEQFVKLIFGAKAVLTDSFHATSFSIIGNVPFYNIRRSNRNSRIDNLYEILGITGRYINDTYFEMEDIDFEKVNKNIERERSNSFEYFKLIEEGKIID